MRKTIRIDALSRDSIKLAKKELRDYKKRLDNKCRSVVSRLITVGIKTAKLNCGEYGDMITFSRDIHSKDHIVVGKLIAVGKPKVGLRGGVEIEIDPLLLAEFGSGWEARVLDKVDGVGQGTFPGQTHAFDPRGWWYYNLDDGESYHTYGEAPTHPMHAAMLAMIFDVNKVLREVFADG